MRKLNPRFSPLPLFPPPLLLLVILFLLPNLLLLVNCKQLSFKESLTAYAEHHDSSEEDSNSYNRQDQDPYQSFHNSNSKVSNNGNNQIPNFPLEGTPKGTGSSQPGILFTNLTIEL